MIHLEIATDIWKYKHINNSKLELRYNYHIIKLSNSNKEKFMKFSLNLGQFNVEVEAEKYTMLGSDVILSGSEISLDLPFISDQYFCHGWQSWSLTSWMDVRRFPATSYPTSLHAMQTDPMYAFEKRPNGSWMGAIKTPDERMLLLGALSLESHVTYDNRKFSGSYEHGNGDWFLAIGSEQGVFNRYAKLLGKRFGIAKPTDSPRIWCSWYSLYKEISENNLLRILQEMDDLPFDVFQIDDGWQKKIGDWEGNDKFPSGMQLMANTIKSTGRKAGIWLAPLLVVPSSTIFQDHSDWLLHDEKGKLVQAGVNWSENLFALDTTHPQVLVWLKQLMKNIREWGFDYVKLDFLYAGALPGIRYQNIPRESAYRHGLESIREALGDAFLLTCGAPILPSLGLCDAIRVGPDVSDTWNLNLESRIMNNFTVPGIQNAIRTTLNRLWLKPIVKTDPDVVYFHSHDHEITGQQKDLLKNLAEITEFKATSDLPTWLTDPERQALQTFLVSKPEIQYNGDYNYLINGVNYAYSEFINFPKPLNRFEKIAQFFFNKLASSTFILRIFDRYTTARIRKKLKPDI